MPESEFDKQVQQELQGLRLHPSEAVWEHVEKELRRKKRRRFVVAFWLLAGISLLGYSGYLLTQKKDNSLALSSAAAKNSVSASGSMDNDTTRNHRDNSDQSAAPNDQPGSTGMPAADNNISDDKQTSANTPAAEKANTTTVNTTSPSAKTNNTAKRINNRSNNKSSHKPSGKGSVETAQTEGAFVSGKRSKPKTAKTENDNAESNTTVTDQTFSSKNNTPQQEPASLTSISGNTDAITQVPTTTDSTASKKDTAIAKVEEKPAVKKKSTPKIKWSLDLAVGLSGPISSPFLLGGGGPEKLALDANALPNQGGIWGAPITSPFGPVYVPRSDIKPGPSARVGLLVELPVSKRSSINTGLQYQYQSNNIRIGYYKDTALSFSNYASQMVSVRAVYQGAQQKTFTNRFHFIQVPFNFNWQVNSGKKLPIILNAGFTAGYLVSTNGLVYDSLQGGIYYHDNSAFNRFQMSINTGLSFRFGNKKAIQWSIGPDFSMGLKKMVKVEYDKKQYPLFIGLQGRIYLPRRR